MRRLISILAIVVALATVGCQDDGVWFKGDLDAARELAEARNTLVMVEFYTSWCTWCRRMDTDTFSNYDVQRELAELVAVKVNAERGGEELAARFNVSSYPTMVFISPEDEEVERIAAFLPPEKFLAEMRRIRAADTFARSLNRLDADPADLEALRRSVNGLLERSDPEGAIDRIHQFHAASGGAASDLCASLMFMARAALHERLYARATRLYRKGWKYPLEVPSTEVGTHLRAALDEGLEDLEREAQATRLREARRDDAGELLADLPVSKLDADELYRSAEFAFANGQYDLAADLYRRWYHNAGASPAPVALNLAAWDLYLSRRELDTAVAIARRAHDANDAYWITDTLARLLYITGSEREAIELQTAAVSVAQPRHLDGYREVLKRMKAGDPLEDRPDFDVYP